MVFSSFFEEAVKKSPNNRSSTTRATSHSREKKQKKTSAAEEGQRQASKVEKATSPSPGYKQKDAESSFPAFPPPNKNHNTDGDMGPRLTKKKNRKRQRSARREGNSNKNGQQPQQTKKPPFRPSSSRPSPQVLELSRKLMELAKRKKLDQAMQLYWNKANDKIRDAHHACIVVDCCARCGSVAQAERVVEAIDTSQRTVELVTALIKGYAHAGDLHNAMRVFRSLFPSMAENDTTTIIQPNVRTLNTILRGCLWTAATKSDRNDGGKFAGGVVSSEEAWNMYLNHRCGQESPPDASSYEASVAILCQALCIPEAKARIDAFQQQHHIRIKGKASIKAEDPDQSILETLGAVYLSLARALALLGSWEEVWTMGQRAINSIQASRNLLHQTIQADDEQSDSQRKKRKTDFTAGGGKRGWKKKDADEVDRERRNASNVSYREHRLNEMEMEVKAILKLRGSKDHQPLQLSVEQVRKRIASSLFYFGGGGSTELSTTMHVPKQEDKKKSRATSAVPNWLSFGLRDVVVDDDRNDKERLDPPDTIVRSHRACFDSKGRLRFDAIFSSGNDGVSSSPVDVEIGAGFGDWVAAQASHCPDRNYVAVELRADRVHSIFSKATLHHPKPLGNLCVIGAEAGHALAYRIPKRSISTVFVNHPEPPTQTFGEDQVDLKLVEQGKVEPAHMLSYSTLKLAFERLRPGGSIVIVTDNHWYARLLCTTLLRLSRQEKSLCSVDTVQLSRQGFRRVEKFNNAVQFFEGQPNRAIGHVVVQAGGGSSYFDRLWRTGTSNYAQKTSRFVIAVQRKDK